MVLRTLLTISSRVAVAAGKRKSYAEDEVDMDLFNLVLPAES